MSEKFDMGPLGIGPLTGMLDSMEFVKQAWATLSLPNNLTPTMDLDEIDRRITDLKVVEQWLTANLGMLRSAIQGMEIQRGTIAAIRAFGDAMASPGEGGDAASRTIAAIAQMQRAAAAAAGAAAAVATRAAAGGGDGGPPPGERDGEGETPRDEDDATAPAVERAAALGDAAAAAPSPSGAGSATQGGPGSLADEISKAAVAAVNPAAWWKLLQSQFGQIAQAALSGGAHGPAAAHATPPAPVSPAARSRAPGGKGTAGKGAGGGKAVAGVSTAGARAKRPKTRRTKAGGGAEAGKRASGSGRAPARTSRGSAGSKSGRATKG